MILTRWPTLRTSRMTALNAASPAWCSHRGICSPRARCVGLAEIDDGRAPLEALHRARDQVAALILELIKDCRARPRGSSGSSPAWRSGRRSARPGRVHLDAVLGCVDGPGVAIDVEPRSHRFRVCCVPPWSATTGSPRTKYPSRFLIAVNAIDDADQIDAHSTLRGVLQTRHSMEHNSAERPKRSRRAENDADRTGRAGGARSSCRDAIEQSNASLDLPDARLAARSNSRTERTKPREPRLTCINWQPGPPAQFIK